MGLINSRGQFFQFGNALPDFNCLKQKSSGNNFCSDGTTLFALVLDVFQTCNVS